MFQLVRLTALTLLILGLCACGGNSLPSGSPYDTTPQAPEAKLDRQAAWIQLEESPGIAGKDYDPSRIMLVYKTDAALPPGWSVPLSGYALAGAQSNPQLRQNKRYEALTDAVAKRYGLIIRRQVYIRDLNLASFELPEGSDGSAILAQIRDEAARMLQAAVFVPLKRSEYVPNDPDFSAGASGPQWSHWQVDCPAAWDIHMGSPSVIVAVVDTGVRLTHQELSAQVINPEVDFPSANCDVANDEKTIEDSVGHGTFIAGMICAEADNNRSIAGVAPLCRVLPIKISNTILASVDDLIAGALLAGQLGAKVVNYSWGGTQFIPSEEAMVDSLTADGVLFVCAAGNDGAFEDEYPTAFTNALSVGATDALDVCTVFSNWGLGVDIAAPGQNLKSCGKNSDSDYDSAGSGTSYAAPMVAAGAGLLWSLKPTLTVDEVREALQFTGPLASDFALPIARLDLGAALLSVSNPIIPSVGSISPAAGSTFGSVTGASSINAQLISPSNVVRVVYRLDLAPPGEGTEDLWLESKAGGLFPVQFDISGLGNQTAELFADYFSATGNSGSISQGPIWIFNQRGDVTADGLVTDADLAALQLMVGLNSADSGYAPYADADLDGTITESDAAAVGYFYGAGGIVPAISTISPLQGIVGTEVSFTADMVGNGQLTFDWNFGGAANPNTSSDPSPTVVLGPAGTYSASLTVSNEFGGDQFDFTLQVDPRPGPSAVLVADRKIGLPPLSVNFDASGSASPGGSIVQYDWSWDGDTNWEDTSAVPSNSHDFTNLGNYTVRLRVTDDQSATAETTLLIKVVDTFTFGDWQSYDIDVFGSHGNFSVRDLDTVMIGDKPCIAWRVMDTGDIKVAMAKSSNPLSASDWDVMLVENSPQAESVSMANIAGQPALVYRSMNGQAGSTTYARYDGSVWKKCFIGTGGSANDFVPEWPSLGNIGGLPVIVGIAVPPADYAGLMYWRASEIEPQPADWTHSFIKVATDQAVIAQTSIARFCVIDAGGRPMVSYVEERLGPWFQMYALASSAAPAGPSDWLQVEMYPITSANRSELGSIAGVPAVFASTMSYGYSSLTQPPDMSTWTFMAPASGSSSKGANLCDINGLPVLNWTLNGGVSVAMGHSATPLSDADWDSETVSLPGAQPSRAVKANGGPAFAYTDQSGMLKFCSPQ